MEAVTGLAYSRRVVPVTFAERVEWVLVNRRLSQEAWAEAAGLSRRYIATTLLRARKDPEYLPTYETLQRLAEAARVSFQWLAEGKGEPEDTAAPALRVVRSGRRHPPSLSSRR